MKGIALPPHPIPRPRCSLQKSRCSISRISIESKKSNLFRSIPNYYPARRSSDVYQAPPIEMSSTMRSNSHSPKTLPLPETMYRVTLSLESNWGDPNLITCSEIDLLTRDRVPIENMKIVPDNDRYLSKNLSLLTNHKMIKSDMKEAWSTKWWKNHPPIVLQLVCNSDHPPEFIRIWNGKYESAAHVRKFTVYIENNFVCTGEAPYEFGVVLLIKSNDFKIKPQFDLASIDTKTQVIMEIDKYGVMAVPSYQRLVFKILGTYTDENYSAGLNCIEFFGSDGKPIPFSAVRGLSVQQCNNLSSPYKLLKPKRRTMELADMWICQKTSANDIPTLIVDLVKPYKIVMIRIWNFNAAEGHDDIGIKKLRIECNDKPIWVGRLNAAKGMISKIVEGVTDIWLTDIEKWKDCPCISDIRTSRSDSSRESTSSSNRNS